MTDLCGGVGPDVGIQFGAMNGLAITGTKDDLKGCSFLFDCDIALGAGVGAAVGVTSEECVTRFVFDVGAGLGGGIGFNGCNTLELNEFVFEGEEEAATIPSLPTMSPTAAPSSPMDM